MFLVVGAWAAGLAVGNGTGFGLASFVHVTFKFAGLRAIAQVTETRSGTTRFQIQESSKAVRMRGKRGGMY